MASSFNRTVPRLPARVTQEWLHDHCDDFIAKDDWPPNSPDLNPLDYHVLSAVWEAYQKLDNKPSTTEELRTTLQTIWNNLPEKPVARALLNFRKRLQACVDRAGGHFEQFI